jgi:hypothetical protein
VFKAWTSRLPVQPGVVLALVAILAVVVGAGIGVEAGPFGSESVTPSESSPQSLGCAITPNASPSATIVLIHQAFGEPVKVTRGEAVAFSNQTNTSHTITEGTFGTAVPGACVNTTLRKGRDLIVTFSVPGDYAITCRRHPSMHTTVHVMSSASPSSAGSGSR